jgi:hypothetical protein
MLAAHRHKGGQQDISGVDYFGRCPRDFCLDLGNLDWYTPSELTIWSQTAPTVEAIFLTSKRPIQDGVAIRIDR